MSDAQKNSMTPADAARIQAAQAKGDKDMGPGGFAARAQAAAARNENANQGANPAGNGGKGDAYGGGKPQTGGK